MIDIAIIGGSGLYNLAEMKNKKEPCSFDTEEVNKRKNLLIISSVIVGVLAAVVIAFAVMLYMAVAYM
ncbi:hypothetical protein [Candidatus Proelusimicrobium excrementi]|mgnify:CR=1 FL=1|uniref:hypothetical protein n=1 Tax=Candidatus Proelusimicrobium excrementi TaxID=3416222 RepID=UPI003D0BD58A